MSKRMTAEVRHLYDRLRDRVNAALEEYMRRDADWPERLNAAMRHSLLAPGKRIRPLLTLLACEACGGNAEEAMPLACAVEMVHTYSLIHDDLPAMDDDELRRGQPTCHIQFDEATAILAGDAFLAYAFEIIAREVHPHGLAAHCCGVLARASGPRHLVGGQADDMTEFPLQERTLERLEAIHRRKTGALLRASLELGANAAHASGEDLDALETFGEALGLAFQITDDLLDVEGTTEQMGKRTQKDREQKKLSYPALLGIEESRRHAEKTIARGCRKMERFGERSEPLIALASAVLHRDH
jgi:geranylgeranyl diphosphate synthase type II